MDNVARWIVINGNPVDGLFYHGPFESQDIASEWASWACMGADWWVTELLEPSSDDDEYED